jgi:nitrile hydratase accessory protein
VIDRAIADDPTLPRRNGELVFDAPWESRAFGLAVALDEAGVVDWDEFRARLVAQIAAWERAHPDAEGWSYYERWHEALEAVLVERGLAGQDEIARRAEAIDHERAHDHEHR